MSSRGLRLWVNRPQFRQYRSTNYGSDDYTPFVTINYTPSSGGTTSGGAGYYGDAVSYSSWNFGSWQPPNCWGYALRKTTSYDPYWSVDSPDKVTANWCVQKVREYINNNISCLLYTSRPISPHPGARILPPLTRLSRIPRRTPAQRMPKQAIRRRITPPPMEPRQRPMPRQAPRLRRNTQCRNTPRWLTVMNAPIQI